MSDHQSDHTPQRVILDAAEKYRVDLIVLGKPRKSGARKDAVMEPVIENAECPVLLSK